MQTKQIIRQKREYANAKHAKHENTEESKTFIIASM